MRTCLGPGSQAEEDEQAQEDVLGQDRGAVHCKHWTLVISDIWTLSAGCGGAAAVGWAGRGRGGHKAEGGDVSRGVSPSSHQAQAQAERQCKRSY